MKKTARGIGHFLTLMFAAMTATTAMATLPAANENVVIATEEINYVLKSQNGQPAKVKMTDRTTYEAQRADDKVAAVTIFNDFVTIDKASAPGAKPYYRSWEPEDLFHTGSRICILEVPVKAGKKVSVTFETTNNTPEQFCNVYLSSPYFTRQSHISIEIPAELAGRFSVEPYKLAEGMDFKRTTAANGNVTYSVDCTNREPFHNEPGAPSSAIDAPQLIVRGMFADAGKLYRYFKSYDTEPADAESSIADLAARLTDGCSSDIAKIDSVASWVRRNIRYVAVEHGKYGIQPAAATDVLAKRYGDCKGSANLIKALLRSSGVDARLAWIGTNDDTPFGWDELPSLMSGNHQIAAAVVGDSIVYIDGTTGYSPDGYIPFSLRGSMAMIEDGDSCMLRRVSMHSRTTDTDSFEARFAVAGKDLRGSVCRTYQGGERSALVNAYFGTDRRNRADRLARVITRSLKNMSCDSTVVLKLDYPSAPSCRLEAPAVTERGAVQTIGDKMYVELHPLRSFGFGIPDMAKRTRGLAPSAKSDFYGRIVLDIPEGYEFATVPPRAEIDNEWFGGFVEYALHDNTVVCTARLTPRRTDATFDEMKRRNDAVRAINRIAESKLVLTKKQ